MANGHVLSEEEIDQFESYIDNAYGNAMETLYTVGNVPMGSPEVMISIQKKSAQSLIATIRDRDETIKHLKNVSRQQSEQNHRLMDALQEMREQSQENEK